MLNIVAFITPKSELYEESKQKLEAVLAGTRAETGCVRFELYENKDKDQLVLVETWINQAALDEHYAQPYITPIFEFYQTALEREVEVHKLSSVDV